MKVRAEQRVAEIKKSLFRDHGDTLGWLLRNFLLMGLIAGAFYTESSVTREANSLNIQIGGPLSKLGFVGLAALIVHKLWRSRSNSQLITRHVPRDAKVFYDLDDYGIVYGIENVWQKSFSWKLVKQIECRSRSFELEVPSGTVSVSTRTLSTEQIQEAIDFFERTRNRIKGDRIDNWLAAATGAEKSFGSSVRPTDTSASLVPPRDTAG